MATALSWMFDDDAAALDCSSPPGASKVMLLDENPEIFESVQ